MKLSSLRTLSLFTFFIFISLFPSSTNALSCFFPDSTIFIQCESGTCDNSFLILPESTGDTCGSIDKVSDSTLSVDEIQNIFKKATTTSENGIYKMTTRGNCLRKWNNEHCTIRTAERVSDDTSSASLDVLREEYESKNSLSNSKLKDSDKALK